MINGYVWWSIYVRTKTIKKMRDEHLPLVNNALAPLEFEWQVFVERESPGLVRCVNYQNISADCIEDAMLHVLRRAYRLADSWTISELGDLDSGELKHITGSWSCRKQSNKPPALESMIFELEPGQIAGKTDDGGWALAGETGKTMRIPIDD